MAREPRRNHGVNRASFPLITKERLAPLITQENARQKEVKWMDGLT